MLRGAPFQINHAQCTGSFAAIFAQFSIFLVVELTVFEKSFTCFITRNVFHHSGIPLKSLSIPLAGILKCGSASSFTQRIIPFEDEISDVFKGTFW